MRSHRRALGALGCTLLLVACDGGTTAPPDLTEASTTPTVPPTAAPSTTVAATTTEEPSTTASPTTAPGTVGLSPDGPWTLVDSAPGVEGVGLTYELMPKLWVFLPTEPDPEHGVIWTFAEEDREIIEAYLLAMLTTYKSISSVPIDLDTSGWTEHFTADLADSVLPEYQSWVNADVHVDLDLGVVLRPIVLEDDRTESYAVLLDCVLDGAVLRNADGSLAAGATPGVAENGYAYALVLEDGRWKAANSNSEASACA